MRSPALAALALLAGCAPAALPPAPDTPEQIALSAFALEREPAAEELERLFGVETDDRRLPDLLDTLDRLPAEPLTVIRAEESDGSWWLELETPAEGGEQQRWLVQLEPAEQSWRIVWLSGPEASWPVRAQPRRYTGLSVSAPPGGG